MTRKPALIILLLSAAFVLRAEEFHHTLPLGESPLRLETATVEAEQVLDTRDLRRLDVADIVARTQGTDVYLIGEFHDDYRCHLFQKAFIEALHDRYPRTVVGLEFFDRDDDPVLEQWRLGEIEEGELLRRTGWYERSSLNFGYTRIVLALVRARKIPVIGLNVSRDIVHRVARGGLSALTKAERELFPTVGYENVDHRYFIRTVFGRLAAQVPVWFDQMYAAQTCWDSVMAESMRRKLKQPEFRGHKGVIIAGDFHVVYGLGIPFRYRKAQRRIRLTTLVPVAVSANPETDAEAHPMTRMMAKNLPAVALFSRGIADFVFGIDRSEKPRFPEFGMKGKMEDGRFVLTEVTPGGWAERSGLRRGDEVVTVDGESISSLARFRHLMAEKHWGDALDLLVRKKTTIDEK